MENYAAATLITLVLIAFFVAFCAYALGHALLQNLRADDQAYPFIQKCVTGLYAGLRLSSWIIVPTFAVWGLWLLISWVLALYELGAQG